MSSAFQVRPASAERYTAWLLAAYTTPLSPGCVAKWLTVVPRASGSPCVAGSHGPPIVALEIPVARRRVDAARRQPVGGRGVRIVRPVRHAIRPRPSAVERPDERAGLDRDEHATRDGPVGLDPPHVMRVRPRREAPRGGGREGPQP